MDIRVSTTVEISDNQGRQIAAITLATDVESGGDNPRFLAGFLAGAARKGCEQIEGQIATLLVKQFGDQTRPTTDYARSLTDPSGIF